MIIVFLTMFVLCCCVAYNIKGNKPIANSIAQLLHGFENRVEDYGQIVPESDISHSNRTIWIFTTASLPWMTGTAVNPLLRAAYLAKDRPDGKVNLVVPWLKRHDQQVVYPFNVSFQSVEEQRRYVQQWLRTDAQLPEAARKLNITFYPARYHAEFHSIFPLDDLSHLVPPSLADVCILEEPEHLNWFKAPFPAQSWTSKFRHVVGVVHTNYLAYSRTHALARLAEPLLYYVNQGMCRAYCHKVIKLSGALQDFAVEKEVVCNVHGVRERYLAVGDAAPHTKFTKGAYFVGKLAWPKGLGELIQLMNSMQNRTGSSFHVDIFGEGPHSAEIRDFANKSSALSIAFLGARDHAELTEHRVFVNPSLSEVLCTTSSEALAMGKWLVVPRHPSNAFFEQFPNCLLYASEEEFAARVEWALAHDPVPLSAEQRHTLSWNAATDRLIKAARMTRDMQQRSQKISNRFTAWALDVVSSSRQRGDLLRTMVTSAGHKEQQQHEECDCTPALNGSQ